MSRIEYIDKNKSISINTIWGCDNQFECRDFCWAKSYAYRFGRTVGESRRYSEEIIQRMVNFEPVYLPEQLKKIAEIKKPSRIFMNFMGETFSDYFMRKRNGGELADIFMAMKNNPHHTYFFLTKRPDNFIKGYRQYPELLNQPNIWVGISTMWGEEERHNTIKDFLGNKFLSIEPIMGNIAGVIDFSQYKWVIIGGFDKANRYKKYNIELTEVKKWVTGVIDDIKSLEKENEGWNIPIFLKNNLKEIWQEELIQELPEEERK